MGTKKLDEAAVGFRVKSGWASAVLLAGSSGRPSVVHHSSINLSDPKRPETKQPYHARQGTLEQDVAKLKKRAGIVRSESLRSVGRLLKEYRDNGYDVKGAGLVVGSLIDPGSIGNLHIRAHALEGKLFRTALEGALRRNGIRSKVMVERNAYQEASSVLRLSANRLKERLRTLSDQPPWRGEEKLAALAAWVVLAGGQPKKGLKKIRKD